MKKPRIAIPEIDQNVTNYTRAVLGAGMEPVVISVQSEQVRNPCQQEYLDYAQFRAEEYDGLLLPGGGDVNPSRYGRENQGSIMIMDELDTLQLTILDDFAKRGRPVLGICRGHQVLNVYFGGTLIQDLPTGFRHSRALDEPDKVHCCRAAGGSWLESLYGTSRFSHNSAHHQAVEHLGRGLVADGWSLEDGVIEAMHHTSLPIYGVQWHPERMCLELERDDTVNGLPVLQFLCRLCGGDPEATSVRTESEIMLDRMGI